MSEPTPKLSSQTKWNHANPKALWAHNALRSAIRRGLISRGCCEVCGAEDTDGHHDDYDRPLDVAWLCRLHHRAEHRRKKCEAA
ncbi:hypothetical protein V7795_21430 [Rhizobium laguerreae]|uniref:hypothetical protein n=1 Tax=Rhizobium laguerreae TaxID=1076926 RepID=UPI002FFF2591